MLVLKNETLIASDADKNIESTSRYKTEIIQPAVYENSGTQLGDITNDVSSFTYRQQPKKTVPKLTLRTEGLAGEGFPPPQEIRYNRSSDQLPNFDDHGTVKGSPIRVHSSSLPQGLKDATREKLVTRAVADNAGRRYTIASQESTTSNSRKSPEKPEPIISGTQGQKAPFSFCPEHVDQYRNYDVNSGSCSSTKGIGMDPPDPKSLHSTSNENHQPRKEKSVFVKLKRGGAYIRTRRERLRGHGWYRIFRVSMTASNITRKFYRKFGKPSNDNLPSTDRCPTSTDEYNSRTASSQDETKIRQNHQNHQKATKQHRSFDNSVSDKREGLEKKDDVFPAGYHEKKGEGQSDLREALASHNKETHNLEGKDVDSSETPYVHTPDQRDIESRANEPRSEFNTDEASALQNTSRLSRLGERLRRFGCSNNNGSSTNSNSDQICDDAPGKVTAVITKYLERVLSFLNVVDRMTDKPTY